MSELYEWLLETPSFGVRSKLNAPVPNPPGQAPLEMLPTEILGPLTHPHVE